jgi:hypothetical protein
MELVFTHLLGRLPKSNVPGAKPMNSEGPPTNKIFIPKGTYVSRGTIEDGGLGLLYRGWSSLIADHLQQPTFIPLFNPIKPIPPWMEKVKNGSPKTGRPFIRLLPSGRSNSQAPRHFGTADTDETGKESEGVYVPNELNVEYHSQRASEAGFMLTEATPIGRHVWEPFCSSTV